MIGIIGAKMKRFVIVICLIVFVISGCNYIGATGGYGGPMNTGNLTIEYGSPFPEELKSKVEPGSGERDWMLTGGITYINNDTETGFYESFPEMGSFAKLGIEIIPDTGFFVTILGGITWIHWKEKYDYEDSEQDDIETKFYGMYGGGVTYFINDKDTCILVGYDNRRGVTAGAGFRF